MKENMKRFAALLLSAMMALCMLPALAEDAVFEDTVDWDCLLYTSTRRSSPPWRRTPPRPSTGSIPSARPCRI